MTWRFNKRVRENKRKSTKHIFGAPMYMKRFFFACNLSFITLDYVMIIFFIIKNLLTRVLLMLFNFIYINVLYITCYSQKRVEKWSCIIFDNFNVLAYEWTYKIISCKLYKLLYICVISKYLNKNQILSELLVSVDWSIFFNINCNFIFSIFNILIFSTTVSLSFSFV